MYFRDARACTTYSYSYIPIASNSYIAIAIYAAIAINYIA